MTGPEGRSGKGCAETMIETTLKTLPDQAI
ncbi:Uncharacterised protein [Nocardia cyriacigeorgica]|uniref:Uncharacterized protein n=1 Tax=Nocardia cyriacigeorgica TaxID=135487 RepID=A0A4U8W637_9NOCA|nr:Uncharacterised protein [Nocardia cyriacigeorgica]